MIYYKKVYDVGVLTPVDYIDRAGNIIERFFHDNIFYVVLTLTIYIAFVLIYLKKGKIQDLWRKSEHLGFLLLSSVSCGALIMSPYIETRAFLLPDFMMTVCIVYYMKGIVEVFDRYQNAVKLVLTVGACVGGLAGIYYEFENINRKWQSDLLKYDYIVDLCNKFNDVLNS